MQVSSPEPVPRLNKSRRHGARTNASFLRSSDVSTARPTQRTPSIVEAFGRPRNLPKHVARVRKRSVRRLAPPRAAPLTGAVVAPLVRQSRKGSISPVGSTGSLRRLLMRIPHAHNLAIVYLGAAVAAAGVIGLWQALRDLNDWLRG